jgi:hypothetical protein
MNCIPEAPPPSWKHRKGDQYDASDAKGVCTRFTIYLITRDLQGLPQGHPRVWLRPIGAGVRHVCGPFGAQRLVLLARSNQLYAAGPYTVPALLALIVSFIFYICFPNTPLATFPSLPILCQLRLSKFSSVLFSLPLIILTRDFPWVAAVSGR